MADRFSIQGLTAASGRPYVCVEDDHAKAIQPLSAFSLADKALPANLASQGINVFDMKELDGLIREVRFLPTFDAAIAEHVGWNRRAYVLPNGQAITVNGIEMWPVTFRPNAWRYVAVGDRKAWKASVARPLAEHPLTTFVLMLPFLAILLRFMPNVPNAMFELEGPSSTGKSTLQLLAASVLGQVGNGGSSPHIVPFETLIQNPAAIVDQHRDQLMIVDQTGPVFATMTAKAGPGIYKAVAYDPPGCQARHIGLISVNRSLRSLVPGANTDGDRLITLRVPDHAPHGVFSAPGDPLGSACFAEKMVAAAAAAHGHSAIDFLQKLIATDVSALKARLDGWQAEFLTHAGIDGNHGVQYRIARVFAAVYAAGMGARRRGSLPKAFRPLDAALYCLQLWRDTQAPPPPFVDPCAR